MQCDTCHSSRLTLTPLAQCLRSLCLPHLPALVHSVHFCQLEEITARHALVLQLQDLQSPQRRTSQVSCLHIMYCLGRSNTCHRLITKVLLGLYAVFVLFSAWTMYRTWRWGFHSLRQILNGVLFGLFIHYLEVHFLLNASTSVV